MEPLDSSSSCGLPSNARRHHSVGLLDGSQHPRWVSIPGNAFAGDVTQSYYLDGFGARVSGTSQVRLWAPVRLPDGTDVSEWKIRVKDAYAAGDVRVLLMRGFESGGQFVTHILGDLSSSGSSGFQELGGAASFTVDNREETYFVQAIFENGGASYDLTLHQVMIGGK